MAVFNWPSQHPTSAAIVFVTATALLSYLAYSHYYLEHTRRAFKLRHGCQPATSNLTGTGPFGIFNMYTVVKAKNNNKLLEFFHERHDELGATYVDDKLHRQLVMTNDPENIKCVLATRFEDWYVWMITVLSRTHHSRKTPSNSLVKNKGVSKKSAKSSTSSVPGSSPPTGLSGSILAQFSALNSKNHKSLRSSSSSLTCRSSYRASQATERL
jgi:hypothetical protein